MLATALHTFYPKPKSRTGQHDFFSNAWLVFLLLPRTFEPTGNGARRWNVWNRVRLSLFNLRALCAPFPGR